MFISYDVLDESIGKSYDNEENPQALYRYDAYGNTTKSNNTLINPYQYNAEYTDSSTGLQYLRARYYDSSQGRFTTKDTLLGSTDKPITRNLYTYCGNNPLNITDPSGHGWFKNAVNSVKKAAVNVYNGAKKAVNVVNKYVVKPIQSFIKDPKGTAERVSQNIKTQARNVRTQATQKWNDFKSNASNKIQSAYNKYVPPKMQKAIEEAKKFVCTTTDRIVKTTTEFIQNVDWKKVAIGVGTTLAIAGVVALTGGAAAPVLIGAAVSAGVSTGITVVSGAVHGDSIEDIAKDASNSFMWGAISGAFGGGTTSLIKSAGKSAADNFVRNNLIEGGVDTVVDLAQTGYTNGEITGKDIALSAITNIGGAFIGSSIADAKTGNNPLTSSNKKSISKSGKNIEGPYSYLEDSASVGEGKAFTAAQKKKIIEENMKKNGGVIKSDLSGEILVPATKSTKGVTPNPLEVNIDHIFPKSAGGSNSFSNAQVLSRAENIAKSNKY